MNLDLIKTSHWFNANKLTVNATKSNVLIITPKINKPQSTVNLYLNNILLPQSSSVKYLGITIDANLAFDQHIVQIEHKISRAVRIISKLKHFIPKKALLNI